jgi:hypothetical protein
MGHSRRLKHLAATSAITLNADIRLRCSICRNGPKADVNDGSSVNLIELATK